MGKTGSHISDAKRREIMDRLAEGGTTATRIAEEVGTYKETVYRIRRQMLTAGHRAITDASAGPADRFDREFTASRLRALQKEVDRLHHVTRQLGRLDGVRVRSLDWASPQHDLRDGRVTGIIHNSDRHLGEVVNPAEINGWNRYDPDVCARRVRRFIDASCDLLRRWSGSASVDGVLYTMAGDEISGDIHDELQMTNALQSLPAAQAAAELHVEGIRQVANEFGRVHVACVPGNHGRTTKKPTAKMYGALSYDTHIGGLVARELRDDPRVSFEIAAGPDALVTIYGRSVLVTHGDKFGASGGKGYAGPELPILRGGHTTRAQYASAGTPLHLWLIGHFHTSANVRGGLANGSVVGMSEFGAAIRAPLDTPKQWCAMLHPRWWMVERLDVQLEEPMRPEKPRVRIHARAA